MAKRGEAAAGKPYRRFARNTPLIFLDAEDVVIIEDEKAPLYDERVTAPIEQAHVDNVRHLGVIEPAVGRRNGDTIEIVAGKARVRWCREASRLNRLAGHPPIKLPVILRPMDDRTALEVAASENAIRVADTPMAKARKAQRLIGRGFSRMEVGRIFGVGDSAICQWVALLRLTPDLQAAVDLGEIRADVARKLTLLPQSEQAGAVEAITAECEGRSHQRKPAAGANGVRAGKPPRRPASREYFRTGDRARDLARYWVQVDRQCLDARFGVLLLYLSHDPETGPADVVKVFPGLASFFASP